MKRNTLYAVAALMVLGGCISPEPEAGRADTNMMRFSTMSYSPALERSE